MKRKAWVSLLAALLAVLTACSASRGDLYDNIIGDASMDMAPSDQTQGAPSFGEPPGIDWNTEEYGYLQENRFLTTVANPLSTFAADVDTASYANLRRMLLAGQEVPADAVRIEEMINYFRYDYPAPAEGEPFSVTTEVSPCPWNQETLLLKVGLQAPQLDWEALPPSNLAFLIDVSGSMGEPNKLPLVQKAFLLLTENLREEDTISIVTYASSDAVVLEGSHDRAAVQSAIEGLMAGGGTNGSQGIQTAYALAERYFIPSGNNRVILATDGDLNIGLTSEGELTRLIEQKKESGVFLSVMGFGTGNLKDNKMEALADHGNGNYAYIDSALEAKRVLVEEMGGTLFTVAKDVKLQVEFDPARVAAYRLIGYEDRLLAAEDFSDDTKDGGEIGAGHRVTALYELVPPGADVDLPEVSLKYQENTPTGSGDYLTVSIRYKEPAGEESKLLAYPVDDSHWREAPSADTAFAACVAQFGMLLRESDYAGTASYAAILETLRQLPGTEEDPYRAELCYLVQQAARMG